MKRRFVLLGGPVSALAATVPAVCSATTPADVARFHSQFRAIVSERGWTCKVISHDWTRWQPVGVGERAVGAVRCVWPATSTAPAKWAGQDLHIGIILDRDGVLQPGYAEDIIDDLAEDLRRNGEPEDADGWRTSLDPVTGHFYRNNVYEPASQTGAAAPDASSARRAEA